MSEYNFEKIKQIYLDLKETLEIKQNSIIKKDVECLVKSDEKLLSIYDIIKTLDKERDNISLTREQKDELNAILEEIQKLENDNKVLIEHSLGVINKIFSGILELSTSNNADYNAMGKKNQSTDFEISSITEEA